MDTRTTLPALKVGYCASWWPGVELTRAEDI
jgi:hypothetical protein